jgi:hypothetical protein
MRSKEVHITLRLTEADAQVLEQFSPAIPEVAITEMLLAAGLFIDEMQGYQVSYPQPHIAIVEPAAVAEGAAA